MKVAIFVLVALQLHSANSKTLPDLPQPCRRSDPNIKDCFKGLIEKMIPRLSKGIPKYHIPSMDPYLVPVLVKNISLDDVLDGTLTFTDIAINNILKTKVKNINVDMDNLVGEVDLSNPEIKVSLHYNADGKLFDSPLQSAGSFKGKFNDIKSHIKLKLKTVEKNGVKYFAIEDLKLKAYVGDAFINVTTDDPEQQPLVDFIQDNFNANPRAYLDLTNPLYIKAAEEHVRPLIDGVLDKIPADALLPE